MARRPTIQATKNRFPYHHPIFQFFDYEDEGAIFWNPFVWLLYTREKGISAALMVCVSICCDICNWFTLNRMYL